MAFFVFNNIAFQRISPTVLQFYATVFFRLLKEIMELQ